MYGLPDETLTVPCGCLSYPTDGGTSDTIGDDWTHKVCSSMLQQHMKAVLPTAAFTGSSTMRIPWFCHLGCGAAATAWLVSRRSRSIAAFFCASST